MSSLNTLTFDLSNDPDLMSALAEKFAAEDEIELTVRVTKQDLTNDRLIAPVVSIMPEGYQPVEEVDREDDVPSIAIVLSGNQS